MRLPFKLRSEAMNKQNFGVLTTYTAWLLAILGFFTAGFSQKDVEGETPQSIARFVRLYSPWGRESPPASSFEIRVEDKELMIRGEVVDANLTGAASDEAIKDEGRSDHIVFAWSRSPLALEFDGVEIFPDGQSKAFRKISPETKMESSSDLQPRISVIGTTNGFQFECAIALKQSVASPSVANRPIYVALSQISPSKDGKSTRSYCSSIPTTLENQRLHPSSFASLESFPMEKQDFANEEVSPPSRSAYRILRIAELELRNKWNQYALQPMHPGLTQKWFEGIANFPDAERFLAKRRDGNRFRTISPDDSPKRLDDARSEELNYLLGQNWSVHLSRIEDLHSCFPLLISAPAFASDKSKNEAIAMWLEKDRLQIAVQQGGETTFWGSTTWPLPQVKDLIKSVNITLTSDGSTNSFGYDLFANAESLKMVTHNPDNLDLLPVSIRESSPANEPLSRDWRLKTKSDLLQVDLYNTKLTPVEVMSLDPETPFLSWAELTESQRQSWLVHYVFCVDPEGRYFLESLKHYTSSQAELLRRSGNPAKK